MSERASDRRFVPLMARDRGWTRANPMLLRLSIFATTIFASHSFVLPPTGPMKPHARADADMKPPPTPT